jgi:integrase
MSATYLTGDLVKKYQESVIAAAGSDRKKIDGAMRTANSTLRQARSLFAKSRMNRFANIYEKLVMPDLNDFMQFPYLKAPKKLYPGAPPGLVEKTWEESAKLKVTAPSLYIAFLLGACAGLRRKEIAYARRSWLTARTLANGRRVVVVEVKTECDFRPKGKRNREIPVSPFVLDEIMKLRGELLPEDYIMPQEGAERGGRETIRCQKTFASFNRWMTGIGWETRMKLHELRKFFGALVAEQFGIYTAKEFLGHASVTTTEDSYSTMLNRKGNVVDVEGDYGIKIPSNNGTCCDQLFEVLSMVRERKVMNTLTRKGYARIYVSKSEDVERVKQIIKELDEFEYEYLPEDLIAPFTEYPRLAYTHKFDGLCMNRLTAVCWKRGIGIWVCDNGNDEFMADGTL